MSEHEGVEPSLFDRDSLEIVAMVVAKYGGNEMTYRSVLDAFTAMFNDPKTTREDQQKLIQVAEKASKEHYKLEPGQKDALAIFANAYRGLEKKE